MKFVWMACFGLLLIACQGNTQEKVSLKTTKDSVSYSIGIDIGKNLTRQSIEIEPGVLAQGLKDAVSGVKPMMTEEQSQGVMMAFQKTMMAKAEEKRKADQEKNKKASDEFLAANKKKDGVQTTASGLQYKVIKMGTGKKPLATDKVSVNYRGTLLDGTEFDNSFKRGQPYETALNAVVPGWQEALLLMPVGSKWELYIPPSLAYGEGGAGQTIPPNATLIFELELLEIK